MLKLKRFLAVRMAPWPALACLASIALFGWVCAQFHLPGLGFTYLIEFSDQEHGRYIPAVRQTPHYEMYGLKGYDSQWYVELAMDPHLGDPRLGRSVDDLTYRARRILLCWTAWLAAAGDPARAMRIYAVQNLVAWVLLALLLWRWLPPDCWGNWARWAAVLFSAGLCASIRGALPDGPSLLLVAAAVALLEAGHSRCGTVVFALSGLAKETNLLAAGAWLPARRGRPADWLRAAGRIALAAAPLAAWVVVLTLWLGRSGQWGARNFAAPFSGYVGKWREIAALVRAHGFNGETRGEVFAVLSLSAQWLFVALRPRWSETWWRVAAGSAALMVFLGPAVWEGYPGAALRVLLPMAVAFNLLVPRGRAWWIVLLLGNLSVPVSLYVLRPPGRESYVLKGPRALCEGPAGKGSFTADFDAAWYPPEKSYFEFWRWCRGDGAIVLRNPQPYAVSADVSFGLRATDRRDVEVRAGASVIWRGELAPETTTTVTLRGVRFSPGDTRWRFDTHVPPVRDHGRTLTFSVRNLAVDLRSRS